MRILFFLATLLLSIQSAHAFCGFYVAKADASLFNSASKVVIARKDDRTVITMANNYEGEPTEFAMVIPVPTVITREQINLANPATIDHLDTYTAPRLVEYFDDNPCNKFRVMPMAMMNAASDGAKSSAEDSAKALGVTIEAEYTVGEYDITILGAEQSDGLQQWLRLNGYRTPIDAIPVLESYIKQGTKFFVAKINLEEHAKTGNSFLRPISVAFESPKFMLPIRLGTVNAKDSQELFVFTLTQKGRVETTNYRTVKIPSDLDIPIFIKDDFERFYNSVFNQAVKKEGGKTLFLEYAWDMNWCDPCAADPLSNNQLRELGVWWVEKGPDDATTAIGQPPTPGIIAPQPRIMPRPATRDVFVTRLHVRYDAENFPEDLIFQETGDRKNFQGRYIMRHPWDGDEECLEAEQYRQSLPQRFENEAKNLANLTNWNINDIRNNMKDNKQEYDPTAITPPKPWWNDLWGK